MEAHGFPNAWKGLPDGAILRRAEEHGCDVFITCDKNILHQQSLLTLRFAVLQLPTNRKQLIMARAADIADTARRLAVGEHVAIMLDGQRILTRPGDTGTHRMPSLPAFER